jgi:hypothetical protein
VRFGPQIEREGPWAEVVGVVGDVKHYSLAVDAPDAFYTVNGQWEWVDNVQTLVVRAGGAEAALVPGLTSAVWSVSAHVPIRQIQTMERYVRASAGSRRLVLFAVGTLAIAALVLAVVGLYGVVAGSVQRLREIGIRTALGAASRDVAGDGMRQAQTLTLTGAAIGLVAAYASSRLTASCCSVSQRGIRSPTRALRCGDHGRGSRAGSLGTGAPGGARRPDDGSNLTLTAGLRLAAPSSSAGPRALAASMSTVESPNPPIVDVKVSVDRGSRERTHLAGGTDSVVRHTCADAPSISARERWSPMLWP